MQPNLFILGGPRCGTTSLHSYLDQHPLIFMSDPKELWYFSHDIDTGYARAELSQYLEHFKGAQRYHQYAGEASVVYLVSHEAVRNILAFNPDARLIAMVRNPIDHAYAVYSYLVQNGYEDVESFEKAWRMRHDRREGRQLPPQFPHPLLVDYETIARFGDQIERLCKAAPNDQVHIIVFDDLISNARAVFRDTLDFLGLGEDRLQRVARVNQNRRARSMAVMRLLKHTRARLGPIKKGLETKLPQLKLSLAALANINTITAPRKPLSPALWEDLAGTFADDIHKLEQLLSQDLSHWLERRE